MARLHAAVAARQQAEQGQVLSVERLHGKRRPCRRRAPGATDGRARFWSARNASRVDGYGLVDLAVALIEKDERFRLSFTVKNVFDQSFAAAISDGGPLGGLATTSFRYLITREADRQFGLTGRVNF